MSSALATTGRSGPFILAIAVVLSVSATHVHGQQSASASAPFRNLSGSWAGTGTVTMSDGAKERIRCRANYAVRSGGNALQQDLRCASPSYTFELNSEVLNNAGTISGNWSERTRNTGGTVSGSVLGNGRIRAVVNGAGFSAAVSVTTRGNRQSVQLVPQGQQQDVSRVSISLRRA